MGTVTSVTQAVQTGVSNYYNPEKVVHSGTLVLFDNGDQCNSITGGWKGYYLTNGTASNVGNYNIDNYLEINIWGIWCGYIIETNNIIDLSEYSNVVFEIDESTREYNDYWCGFQYGTTVYIETGCNNPYPDAFNEKRVYRYDISEISEGKIYIKACNGCSIKCSKIYLEK